MALTPQEISEKSFSTRFRGADPAEVRAFFKIVAAQISDLQERIDRQHRKIEEQGKELELAADDKKSFDDVLGVYKENIEQLRSELISLRDRDGQRAAEHERLRKQGDISERERERLAEKLSGAEAMISELERELRLSRATVEELRTAVAQLETDKRELKNRSEHHAETVAQARLEAEELVERGGRRAQQLIADARERIEEQRDRAVQEIAGLLEDIERLKKQRNQLSDDLRTVLNGHLKRLDVVVAGDGDSSESDDDELFHKIDFVEMVEFDLGDEAEVLIEDQLNGQAEEEDSEDRLRRALKDGGVAYLSDE